MAFAREDINPFLTGFLAACGSNFNRHQPLYSLRTTAGQSVVDYAIAHRRLDVLAYLYQNYPDNLERTIYLPKHKISQEENEHIKISLTYLKTLLCSQSNPNLNECIQFYIRMLNAHLLLPTLSLDPVLMDTSNLLKEMFGEKEHYDALERATANVFELWHNPPLFAKYLRYLNDEGARYWRETHGTEFPKLSPSSYTFKVIDGLPYPIPNSSFIGIEKASAFQEFLFIFLRKHGWSNADINEIIQWVGFVPNDKADSHISAGSFVTEARLNESLFHGKLSHMLQIAMICLGIEDGKIPKVPIKELISFLVKQKSYSNKDESLWQGVLDSFMPDYVLCSPHSLQSMIMREGHGELQTPFLADYLIDTFCKGFNKLVALKHELDGKTTAKSLLDQLQYDAIHLFSNEPQLTLKYVEKKQKDVLEISMGDDYAEIRKAYHPNPAFITNPYSLFAEKMQQEQVVSTEINPVPGASV